MKRFLRRTFGPVAAITYLSGVALHLVRILSSGFSVDDIPFWFDAWVVVAAGYGGLGYLLFWREVLFQNRLSTLLYPLITVHLLGSSALHVYTLIVRNHEAYKIFPMEYSYVMVVVMASFAWYSWRLKSKKGYW